MVSPSRYVEALKAEGLRVTAHPGWTEENRPGPWDPIGVAIHHTGPYSTVANMIDLLMNTGRPDLPPPLCHAGDRPSGIIDLVGWYDTNHAGLVDPTILAAMRAGERPPLPRSPSSKYDTADGNAALYGLEMYHPGDTSPYDPRQIHASVLYATALCRLHGWNANHCVYHKGLTVRKRDPSSSFLTITEFRRRVAARLAGPVTYTVQAGDTIPQVCEQFRVTAVDLWRANRKVLTPGEVLTIPSKE